MFSLRWECLHVATDGRLPTHWLCCSTAPTLMPESAFSFDLPMPDAKVHRRLYFTSRLTSCGACVMLPWLVGGCNGRLGPGPCPAQAMPSTTRFDLAITARLELSAESLDDNDLSVHIPSFQLRCSRCVRTALLFLVLALRAHINIIIMPMIRWQLPMHFAGRVLRACRSWLDSSATG